MLEKDCKVENTVGVMLDTQKKETAAGKERKVRQVPSNNGNGSPRFPGCHGRVCSVVPCTKKACVRVYNDI